ncbi:MAG: hypothetical protein JRF06_06595 [Deltaproteobacteria bacterium]|nr:hypothetical protein [Deltaproteobacteria bacterium]
MKKISVSDFRYGEKIFCKDKTCENIGTILEIKKRGVKIKYTETNTGRWFYFEDSKIFKILRRIEDMTEKENAEFRARFTVPLECECVFENEGFSTDFGDFLYMIKEYD